MMRGWGRRPVDPGLQRLAAEGDSLPDLDTSGLCLVKTLSTALTCWPDRSTALRDGARTSTRTSSVAKGRTASIHCRPAPPRETEPFPAPENVAAKRCASEKRAF